MKCISIEALVNIAINASFLFSYTNLTKLRILYAKIEEMKNMGRVSLYPRKLAEMFNASLK